MTEKIQRSLVDAFKLEEDIVDAVFNYVDEDVTKTQFGINAAVRASISLIKGSSMSPETRMALAQNIFVELTDDIPLHVIEETSRSH